MHTTIHSYEAPFSKLILQTPLLEYKCVESFVEEEATTFLYTHAYDGRVTATESAEDKNHNSVWKITLHRNLL